MKDFPPTLTFRQPLSGRSLRAELCVALGMGVLIFGAPWLRSQTTQPASKSAASSVVSKIAEIKSFRIVQEKDGPAVEILSTRPLVPSIQAITDPDRLVIDLPNARLETPQKRISIQADQISTLRADQFQQNPPVARVVVDLLAPRAYTWDAAGNRLVVHLGKNPNQATSSPFQAPTVPSLTPAPQPVVTAVRAAGPLALAGNDGSSGSAITAGPDTAVLRLSSGGEVHVCPGTTVSVTPSQNRHNLMLSMNTGALEAHFALDASSDSVMTPDFRILLVGPGEFHYAISADNQGNTCVRALPGNTASAMVSELLGDRTYQVKATDQLLFHSGQLDRVDRAVPLECGCPPPRDAPLRATADLPMQSRAQSESPNGALPPMNASPAPAAETPRTASATATGAPAPAAPLDASVAPNELHVQVEAPLVFHATGPPPAPVEDVRALPLDSRPAAAPALATPLPPPASGSAQAAGTESASAKQPPARGFFRRLGGFFAALFR
ncbi:MAG TPA: AMIN domain-containing protein [Terriglobales bacterium]|nr:AMIN domain-containing protein [Terriglobales bacterium]